MRLLVIFGPPAVGKMTVGRAVAARSDFRLHHNHAVIEPLLEVFDYGTPSFVKCRDDWRQQVFDEAARSGIDLVFTFVWSLGIEADTALVRAMIAPYVERGAAVAFVELVAGLETRLERNRTEHRLAEKRSKRDVEWSHGNVIDLESHVMNTGAVATTADGLLAEHRHLVLDNTGLTADQSAERILAWLETPGW